MAKVWQERTKAPTEKDLYYVSKKKGGYNPFVNKDLEYFGNGGNCTAYVFARFCEVGSISSKGIIQKTCKLPLCNAEDVYSQCTAYEKGQTPRRGAVLCFSKGKKFNGKDGAGHVAIVENFDDKYVYTSEAGYRHYLFKRAKYPIKNGKPYLIGYNFEGYIYNPWEENNYQEVAPKKETPKTYKVRVTAKSGLNVRKGAGTVYGAIKVLPFGAEVTVYETKNNWSRIGVNQWVSNDWIRKV